MRTAVVVVAAQCSEGVNELGALIVVSLGEEHVAGILPGEVVQVHCFWQMYLPISARHFWLRREGNRGQRISLSLDLVKSNS